MVFKKSDSPMFYNMQTSNIISSTPIKSFQGCLWYEGHNIINMNLGELLYIKNMEYLYSGADKYLNTRRGSTLVKDIQDYSVGSSIFVNSTDSYLLWVDSVGKLNAIDSAGSVTEIATGVNAAYHNDSFFYALAGNETAYFCNQVDGIFKVTQPFTKSNVLSRAITSICYSNISGRMLATEGHRVNISNVQNQTAIDTSSLETFDDQDWILVNPTEGKEIYKAIDNGEITFLFKDTGIWAVLNANEDLLDWIIPKCNADIGTVSPETVQYCRYGQAEGFIYLGSDKTLRYFNASVSRNSGVLPSLVGGDSRDIGKPFQKLLKDIPKESLPLCKAIFFDRYYILCIPEAGGTDLLNVIVIDTDKLMTNDSSDIQQPYWFLSDKNLSKADFVILNQELYGFSRDGFLVKMFVDDLYYDEMPERMYVYDGTTLPEYASKEYIDVTVIGEINIGDTISNGTATAKAIDVSSDYVITAQATGQFAVGDALASEPSLIDFYEALRYSMENDGGKINTNTITANYTINAQAITSTFYGNNGVGNGRSQLLTTGISGKDIAISFWADNVSSGSGTRNYLVNDGVGTQRILIYRNSGYLILQQNDGVGTNYVAYTLPTTSVMRHFTIIMEGSTGAISLYINKVLQTPAITSSVVMADFNLSTQYIYGPDNVGTTLNTAIYAMSFFDYQQLSTGYTDQQIADTLYANFFLGYYATITGVKKLVEIPWSFYTGWYKYSDNELRLYDAYVNYKASGYWPITMKANSFTAGGSIPDFDSGLSTTLYPDNIIRNKTSFVNASFISNKGQISQNFGESIRGNYFNFGFSGSEQATIYSIEPRFVAIKNGPMGNNK